MFDAILFDLDGTLIDTESLAMTAGLAAFTAFGQPVDQAFMHSLVGVDLPNAGRMIAAAHPNLDVAALNAHWQQGFQNAMALGLPLKPGVEILLAARVRPMAVVTSSGRREAHHKLNLTGVAGAFAHVITVDDVQSAKPAPDPYLLAAKRMGTLPSRCLVFEDSETGAESAYRAGCYVVQVPDVVPSKGRWAHHLAADLLSGARLVGLI
jgi:HAD superfamily hydrolase (TIGR01509 family)